MTGLIKKAFIGLLFIGFVFSAIAQTNESGSIDSIKFIPVSKIPDYQIKAENKFFEVNKFISEVTNLSEWQEKITDLENEIKNIEHIVDSINISTLTTEQLQKWNRVWRDIEVRIKTIYDPVDAKIGVFEGYYNEVDALYHLWLETIIVIKNKDLPDDLKKSTAEIKLNARNLRNKIKEEEGKYISLKHDCNILFNKVIIEKRALAKAREDIVKNLLIAEQPVIWKSISIYYNDTIVKVHNTQLANTKGNAESFLKSDPSFVYSALFIFVVFLTLIIFIKKNLNIDDYKDKGITSNAAQLLLNRPVIFSLVLTWLSLSIFFYLPVEIRSAISILMLVPVLFLLKRLFGKQSIAIVVLFITYYLFSTTKFLFYEYMLLSRLSYLLLAMFSVIIVWHIIKQKIFFLKFKKWGWFIRLVFHVVLVIFAVSAIFYITGNVTLATMLLFGAIGMVLAGIIIYAAYELLYSLVILLLENKFFQKSHVIRNHINTIQVSIRKIITVLLFFNWITITLGDFGIKSEVFLALKEVYMHQFKIGSTSFGLNNIVSFILVIYISIIISRILLVVLKEEVFVRSKTDKGVSSTIVLLLRYSIISLGFIFALAAAGIELANISILIGALGVGIGFGLQDIFNNLISGIILAIERPIKVDDIIQVGDLTGIVKDIGFRSSKVRTYDGSEVIVPNGDIVSNQMINWTLSDRKRRLKIDLGVSYDSDPEEIIEILKEITDNHPNVEQNPAPRPRFLGFGDSTLDFQLLFWIADYENSFGMGTEITLDLYKKLKERGIRIPYPKQDIRIIRDE